MVVKFLCFCRFHRVLCPCGSMAWVPPRVLGGAVKMMALNLKFHCLHGNLTLVKRPGAL